MSLPRVYSAELEADMTTVTLTPSESHHLTHVLRVTPGAHIRVFNGRGLEVEAIIESSAAKAVGCRVLHPVASATELTVRLTLAQALLTSAKMDDVIRDATMMGVHAIQPLVSARTNVPASAVVRGDIDKRWTRIAVASAKQCGRAVVPVIRAPIELNELLEAPSFGARLFLVEPGEHTVGASSELLIARPSEALLVVGPEGGWTSEEVMVARAAGCQLWQLGQRTLRADAAATVALAVLTYLWCR